MGVFCVSEPCRATDWPILVVPAQAQAVHEAFAARQGLDHAGAEILPLPTTVSAPAEATLLEESSTDAVERQPGVQQVHRHDIGSGPHLYFVGVFRRTWYCRDALCRRCHRLS